MWNLKSCLIVIESAIEIELIFRFWSPWYRQSVVDYVTQLYLKFDFPDFNFILVRNRSWACIPFKKLKTFYMFLYLKFSINRLVLYHNCQSQWLHYSLPILFQYKIIIVNLLGKRSITNDTLSLATLLAIYSVLVSPN